MENRIMLNEDPLACPAAHCIEAMKPVVASATAWLTHDSHARPRIHEMSHLSPRTLRHCDTAPLLPCRLMACPGTLGLVQPADSAKSKSGRTAPHHLSGNGGRHLSTSMTPILSAFSNPLTVPPRCIFLEARRNVVRSHRTSSPGALSRIIGRLEDV